jgi:hypothetical protein
MCKALGSVLRRREEGRKEGRRETYCMAKPHFIYSFMRP